MKDDNKFSNWLKSFPKNNNHKNNAVNMNGLYCIRTGRTILFRKVEGQRRGECLLEKESVCNGCGWYNLVENK